MAGYSKEKFAHRIRDEINASLRKDFSDPRLTFVSITKVELAGDYSEAKVFWDTYKLEEKDDIASAVKNLKGKIRTKLAKILKVKHTPNLVFIYDNQFESENHIEQILNKEAKNGKSF